MKTGRELEEEKKSKEIELIEKARVIEELTNHAGWKLLVEIAEGILERERRTLAGQSLDHTYYRKIGFLQMYKFFFSIPEIIKDKKVREYVLTQGKATGLQTAINSPRLFIEGVIKGNAALRSFFEKNNDEQIQKEKNKYHEDILKN